MGLGARLVAVAFLCMSGVASAQQVTPADLFTREDKGNCIACHQVPASVMAARKADVGPPLSAAGIGKWDRARLRALFVDPIPANPDAVMPPFGRHLILGPAEIELLVTFLMALPDFAPDETTLADAPTGAAHDGGRSRPAPQAAEAIKAGKRLWTRKFKNGRSLAGCFPNGGRRVATAYPQYDRRLRRVVTLEVAINQCLKAHGQPLLDADDPATMGAVLAYVRSLSDGQKVAIRFPGDHAQGLLEEGKRLYHSRMGQHNYACATCHVRSAGKHYAGSRLHPAPDSAVYWPYFRADKVESFQVRVRECLARMGAAPYPVGAEELANLEYYLASLANGKPLRPNSQRD